MEKINHNESDARREETAIKKSVQTNVWPPADHRATNLNTQRLVEISQAQESQESRGKAHACKASYRALQQASDRLKRANRDLGETAAFIAASLTTVTAVEAVINLATKTIILSKELLQVAFDGYIALMVLILLWGALRASAAIHKRTRAEREVDQAKKGIFEFCPGDPFPKLEEL